MKPHALELTGIIIIAIAITGGLVLFSTVMHQRISSNVGPSSDYLASPLK